MSARVSRVLSGLPYFVAVAEELHFARAARRLGISQPPLSRRVQILEKELGSQLFRRTRHHVLLTEAGEALLRRAKGLINQAEEAIEEVQRLSHGAGCRVRVGFVNSTLRSVLPTILREFSTRCPDVQISLDELSTEVQLKRLQAGTIDVGLLRLAPGEDHGLRTAVVRRDPMMAVVPVGHPFARRKSVQLSELRDEPFVTFSRQFVPRLHEQVLQYCEKAGFSPMIAQVAQRTGTIMSLVSTGFGVALVPATAEVVVPEGVRIVRIGAGDVQVSVAIARSQTSKAVDVFFEIAKSVAKSEKTRERDAVRRGRKASAP